MTKIEEVLDDHWHLKALDCCGVCRVKWPCDAYIMASRLDGALRSVICCLRNGTPSQLIIEALEDIAGRPE